jgi:deoxyribodipyrimidine photo-lyase
MPTFNAARVRKANDRPTAPAGRYVLLWLQMARRLAHNHALDYAVAAARHLGKPLVVYEGLKLNPPWATARFHRFLLDGMRENVAAAKRMGLTYWPFVETPGDPGRGLVRKLAADAALVVTDDYPAYIVPAQVRAVAARIDVGLHAVDANGVVPLSLLGAPVGAAAHLRPRLHRLFPEAWPHRSAAEPDVAGLKAKLDPPFEPWTPPKDLPAFVRSLPVDQTVPPVPDLAGGPAAGRAAVAAFVRDKLAGYADGRNQPDDPERNAASRLSPYLHYGHVGMDEVVSAVLDATGTWSADLINRRTWNKDDYFCRDPNVNGFLDEAITWRDVGYHWHFCRAKAVADAANVSWEVPGERPTFNFGTMDYSPLKRGTLETVLPEWARRTLDAHAGDRREHLYTPDEFEAAATHDELWNAAQRELVATGRIHNYLRMLWGKKVVEWSATPEEAYRTLEHLNNRYAIDGRDPNSYTGVLWCFGLFDRPWPPERAVFGTVRYMSSANTAKKFDLAGYYEYVGRLPTVEQVRAGTPTAVRRAARLF